MKLSTLPEGSSVGYPEIERDLENESMDWRILRGLGGSTIYRVIKSGGESFYLVDISNTF